MYLIKSDFSNKIKETPQGYLICLDAPISRTGLLDYSDVDPNDPIRIRLAEDLFDAKAIASFEGAPVTLGHPADNVDSTNWNDLAVGFAQNVRRGLGDDADKLMADLRITNSNVINLVKSGVIRQLSCGFNCVEANRNEGIVTMKDIRGNHVALVSAGRCGEECSIKDSAENIDLKILKDAINGCPTSQPQKKKSMNKVLLNIIDKLSGKTDDSDQMARMDAALKKFEDAIKSFTDKMAAPAVVKDEADEEDEDDNSDMTESAEDLVNAEILSAGIEKGKDLKRRALDGALKNSETSAIIKTILCGKKLKDLKDVSIPFAAATELVKKLRESKKEVKITLGETKTEVGGIKHLADYQK